MYRDDKPALVALGLILLSVVMIAVVGLLHRVPVDSSIVASLEARGPLEGYWWPEFSTRDTYANWLTALLALVATGISLVGLVLVRRTFIETRRTANAAIEANATARLLGEAQVRAYVSWDHASTASMHAQMDGAVVAFRFAPVIKNTGQSPATLKLLYVDMPLLSQSEPAPNITFSRMGAEVEHELGAGNVFNLSDRFLSMDEAWEVYQGKKRCFLFGYGEYRDVFWQRDADTRVFRFCFEVFIRTPPDHTPIEQFFLGIQFQNVPFYDIAPHA
ncbi:MAG TPA: hypothetical protein VIL88_14795 [Devosia sp.]|uniref:hypothetical protein n=1 Tax=Devosia sp. TaxID=1871048 RepID=UPI002F958D7E